MPGHQKSLTGAREKLAASSVTQLRGEITLKEKFFLSTGCFCKRNTSEFGDFTDLVFLTQRALYGSFQSTAAADSFVPLLW